MPDPLEIFALPLGPLQANCFVVVQGQTGLVIDPGDEAGVIIAALVVIPGLQTFAGDLLDRLGTWWGDMADTMFTV